jgi:hypothetical protein
VVAVTASNFHVVLTHLRSKSVTVARAVFDEANNIRLPKCSGLSMPSRFHWFVTASPHNLYSVMPEHGANVYTFAGCRVEYAHAAGATKQALSFGCPYVQSGYVRDFFMSTSANHLAVHDCLCAITVMSDDAFVDASFRVPLALEETVMCRAEATSTILVGIVHNAVIDMLNAGDVRGAVAALNPTCVASDTNVIATAVNSLEAVMSNLTDMTREGQNPPI